MSTRSRFGRRFGRTVLALITLSIVACGETSIEPSGIVRALSINGTASFAQPGDVVRLIAVAAFSEGSVRDVTAKATWQTTGQVISIVGPGTAKAERYGAEPITVSYGGRFAKKDSRVAPEGAFLLTGMVRTQGGIPVEGARVEFASRCGTVSNMTDANGSYTLPAQGETTMRVEKDGFDSVSMPVSVDDDGRRDFTLQFATASGNASTKYQLLVVASPTCALPLPVMRRTYGALMEQMGSDLYVTVDGGDFVAYAGRIGFTGSRTGDLMRFVIRDTMDDGFNLVERVPNVGDVYFSGTAEGTLADPEFFATFSGKIDVKPLTAGGLRATCQAVDHRLEFVRR